MDTLVKNAVEIDVIMPTWNSNKPFFERVLVAIKRYVPLYHLIIIDRFSGDGTLEVIRSIFPRDKVFVIRSNARLARARWIGIKHVDTPFFAFIDDDVEVTTNWFKECWSVISSSRRIAAVQPLLTLPPRHVKPIETVKPSSQVTIKDIICKGLLNQIRMATTHTLIRTETVKDWTPSIYLSGFEDYDLTRHIIDKGFLVIKLNKKLGIDHKCKRGFHSGAWHGAGMKLTNAISFDYFLINVLARCVSATIRGDFNSFLFCIGMFMGFLFPKTFVEVTRK